MEQVLYLSINATFLKSMAKIPNFAKDVMTNCKELEKSSTILLNELCSVVIINEFPIKMGDPGRLTFPCEFDNFTSINALANLGARINVIPYSFYKRLGLPRLQDTEMTLRLVDHTITNPHGIIEDLLVKVGKFIFPVDFVVLNMKENDNLPIILGRPFLSTTRALVDTHDSKLTLRVENEEITFDMIQKVSNDKQINEMLVVNDCEEENFNGLNELEKLMEEELKTWEKPNMEKVERTKPCALVPINF